MNGMTIGGSGYRGSSAASYEEIKKQEYGSGDNSAKPGLTVSPRLSVQSISEHDTFFRHIENNLEAMQDRLFGKKCKSMTQQFVSVLQELAGSREENRLNLSSLADFIEEKFDDPANKEHRVGELMLHHASMAFDLLAHIILGVGGSLSAVIGLVIAAVFNVISRIVSGVFEHLAETYFIQPNLGAEYIKSHIKELFDGDETSPSYEKEKIAFEGKIKNLNRYELKCIYKAFAEFSPEESLANVKLVFSILGEESYKKSIHLNQMNKIIKIKKKITELTNEYANLKMMMTVYDSAEKNLAEKLRDNKITDKERTCLQKQQVQLSNIKNTAMANMGKKRSKLTELQSNIDKNIFMQSGVKDKIQHAYDYLTGKKHAETALSPRQDNTYYDCIKEMKQEVNFSLSSDFDRTLPENGGECLQILKEKFKGVEGFTLFGYSVKVYGMVWITNFVETGNDAGVTFLPLPTVLSYVIPVVFYLGMERVLFEILTSFSKSCKEASDCLVFLQNNMRFQTKAQISALLNLPAKFTEKEYSELNHWIEDNKLRHSRNDEFQSALLETMHEISMGQAIRAAKKEVTTDNINSIEALIAFGKQQANNIRYGKTGSLKGVDAENYQKEMTLFYEQLKSIRSVKKFYSEDIEKNNREIDIHEQLTRCLQQVDKIKNRSSGFNQLLVKIRSRMEKIDPNEGPATNNRLRIENNIKLAIKEKNINNIQSMEGLVEFAKHRIKEHPVIFRNRTVLKEKIAVLLGNLNQVSTGIMEASSEQYKNPGQIAAKAYDDFFHYMNDDRNSLLLERPYFKKLFSQIKNRVDMLDPAAISEKKELHIEAKTYAPLLDTGSSKNLLLFAREEIEKQAATFLRNNTQEIAEFGKELNKLLNSKILSGKHGIGNREDYALAELNNLISRIMRKAADKNFLKKEQNFNKLIYEINDQMLNRVHTAIVSLDKTGQHSVGTDHINELRKIQKAAGNRKKFMQEIQSIRAGQLHNGSGDVEVLVEYAKSILNDSPRAYFPKNIPEKTKESMMKFFALSKNDELEIGSEERKDYILRSLRSARQDMSRFVTVNGKEIGAELSALMAAMIDKVSMERLVPEV